MPTVSDGGGVQPAHFSSFQICPTGCCVHLMNDSEAGVRSWRSPVVVEGMQRLT